MLALGSAVLLWLGWPPIPFSAPILLVALVPLFIAIENITHSGVPRKGRKVFLITGLCFLTWNTASIYWVFNAMNAVMPALAAFLISLIPFGLGALLMTLAFRLFYSLKQKTTRAWSYAGLISFWIGYEYLHQTWDLSFPWMNLGNGFAGTHQLVQWYEFTGVYGGTLWVLLVNILIFETWFAFKGGKDYKRWLLYSTVLMIMVPASVSLFMYVKYREHKDPSNIVVVQPNIDPYAKWGLLSSAAQVEKLARLSDSVAQTNTEYFIWPETSIPEYVNEGTISSNVSFLRVKDFLQKYKNGNLICGIESYLLYDDAKTPTSRFEERAGKYLDYFNTAIQVENSANTQFYHKSKLVPGVEQLPFSSALAFLKPVFAAFGGSSGGFGRQDQPSVFYSQSGIGAAPVICYESVWGGYVAEYVKQGAQFIAIITNDGWWGNTAGKDQHLQYAKLRAIETRRWVARSANTGISAFINQRGDIVQRTEWWTPDAIKQDINLNEELTFYVQTGDYIAYAGCAGSGVFGAWLLIMLFKRKR